MKLKAVSLTIIIMMCIVYSCTVFAASDSNISFSTTNVTLITTGEKSADLVDFVNKAKTYAIENGKDKALAEVSALLVLKKKVDLLWGGSEDK